MLDELLKQMTDTGVFIDSINNWVCGLSVNSAIIFIMMIFMVIGAIDKINGNKFGYGESFDEGFRAMGPLAIAMAGVVAAAPVLAIILKPVVVPIYEWLGADSSIFATTILASDMGGYPLAMEMAANKTIGNFSGLILGSMMGPTMVFTIPVALTLIKSADRPYLGAGILAGMITIPIGCLAGGLAMNLTQYKISLGTIVINLIPVMLLAGFIVICLWIAPDKMIRYFQVFGSGVTALITVFTLIAVFQYQTGIRFPLFYLMVEPDSKGNIPLESGLLICGQIATILIGAFPMIKWITRHGGRLLNKTGVLLKINENASAGLVASFANCIPMFYLFDKMDAKGKLLNTAFAVSAAALLGDHLGFTAGVNPDMVFPVILGKLTAGITALLLANHLSPVLLNKIQVKEGK